ncbi:MAG: tRNA uridine-5-carboxymethylaminomethyl(34) synthesis GTPase MnmE [Bacillota bacterium]|jgi:tRNA modification GTPase|nr:tRNA uridine-5-carboxymethylaminomethyl(34) synthesis GTPase MnmE [Bacillota bacterium]
MAVINDTIAAIATPLGEGGIGIVRISGPEAVSIGDQMFAAKRGDTLAELGTYKVRYGRVLEPETNRQLDEALALVMLAPHSYTGEDVVEIQCHGGVVVIREILDLALRLGARLAEPGEFTKRAFLNGRLDLSQAEAVMDIIQSQTRLGLEVAVDQLEGSLSRRIVSLSEHLFDIVVRVEASIDFPEDDLPEILPDEIDDVIVQSLEELDELLATADEGKMLREGLRTVITGRPNVGKSTLLNKLLDENRALVTDIPGTTRDAIEETINLRGIPLRLVDTAGIRETGDVVERLGVERSLELLDQADLVLHVLDRSVPLSEDDLALLQRTEGRRRLILINKADLPPVWDAAELGELSESPVLETSLVTEDRQVVDELAEAILACIGSGRTVSAVGSRAMLTRARHKQAVQNAQASLRQALETVRQGLPLDLIAVDLYAALEFLGEITGETVRENVLDRIFAQFCIGK